LGLGFRFVLELDGGRAKSGPRRWDVGLCLDSELQSEGRVEAAGSRRGGLTKWTVLRAGMPRRGAGGAMARRVTIVGKLKQ
jgi:hypothetical protein